MDPPRVTHCREQLAPRSDALGIDVHGGRTTTRSVAHQLEYISIRRGWHGLVRNAASAIYNDGANTGVMERNSLTIAE